MSTKHTPGPLEVFVEDEPRYCSSTGARLEGRVKRWVRKADPSSPNSMVALICHASEDPIGDANLFAAAPEMHETLEAVSEIISSNFRDHMSDGEHTTVWACPFCEARFTHADDCVALMVFAALAKARGEG